MVTCLIVGALSRRNCPGPNAGHFACQLKSVGHFAKQRKRKAHTNVKILVHVLTPPPRIVESPPLISPLPCYLVFAIHQINPRV